MWRLYELLFHEDSNETLNLINLDGDVLALDLQT